MREGLAENIDAIIEKVAAMECIKPYILVGGTALAMQIGHRKSEDLDFMMWRKSKTDKPKVDWTAIEMELTDKICEPESFKIQGLHRVEIILSGVKFSFCVSDNYCPVLEPVPYLGNIRLADIYSIMSIKMEEMLRGMKVRDYYDIYSIINEGYDISEGIKAALRYSQQKLNAKNIMTLLISEKIMSDQNFEQLEPKYKVSKEVMRLYILQKLKTSWYR